MNIKNRSFSSRHLGKRRAFMTSRLARGAVRSRAAYHFIPDIFALGSLIGLAGVGCASVLAEVRKIEVLEERILKGELRFFLTSSNLPLYCPLWPNTPYKIMEVSELGVIVKPEVLPIYVKSRTEALDRDMWQLIPLKMLSRSICS